MIDDFSIDYKQLYANAPCGYVCYLVSGEIVSVNEMFSHFTGFSKEEILYKKKVTDFISKAQQIFYETHFKPILKVEGKIEEVNFSIIRKNKSRFPVLISAVEVKNEAGELAYIQATVYDISQRKQYELQLLDARKRADELTADFKSLNAELKEKNKLLRGGLNYSKKIQYSILPKLTKIQNSFKDAFIYYKPKAEIGGDFYWHWKNESYAFIAVIDCTGHGVPGALMSMSINAMLNEILQKRQSVDPGEILSLLHNKVYLTLQQEQGDEYSQDGCEIAICRLDLSTNTLAYAGANIDLWICNQDNQKTIQSTNKSIGGLHLNGSLEPTRNFETVRIPYSPNSLIIISTDGLEDQLNQKDEAFGIQAFQLMLEKVRSNPTLDGKTIVKNAMANWMEDAPQLDDMLLLGFYAPGA